MTIITRNDNIEFIAQPYREQLAIRNYTILKREVRYLAQINGQFVRLFKLPNGDFEAVFSHDPGFLLGETVWRHYGKPDNLIYCEEINKEEVLLVVVKEGAVFLDGKYLKTAIRDELAVFSTVEIPFLIKTSGDVPICFESGVEGKVYFNPKQVKSHVELTDAVFEHLSVSADLQLMSLEQALLEHRAKLPTILVALTVAIVVVGGFLFFSKALKPKPVAPEQKDPWLNYRTGLETPGPTAQLSLLAQQISETSDMPGWIATSVSYANGTAQFQLHSLGGTLKDLLTWAHAENAQINLGPSGAVLQISGVVDPRPTPATITNAKQVTAAVIDNFMEMLPGKSVTINSYTNNGVYTEADLTVSVTSITPDILDLMGATLKGLPARLDAVSFSLVQGALLSGTIQIAILGN